MSLRDRSARLPPPPWVYTGAEVNAPDHRGRMRVVKVEMLYTHTCMVRFVKRHKHDMEYCEHKAYEDLRPLTLEHV